MKIGEGATFQTDLQIGERVEKLVLMIIQHKYPQAYKRAGYFKEYDLVIPEIGKTVEVKAHLISRTNYWVETGYDGKPSGIITSTACVDWMIEHQAYNPDIKISKG